MAKKAPKEKKDNRKFEVVSVPVRDGVIEALQITVPVQKVIPKQDLLAQKAQIDELLAKFPK